MNVLGMVFSMCGLMMRVMRVIINSQIYHNFTSFFAFTFTWKHSSSGVPGLLFTALALALLAPGSMMIQNRSCLASCNTCIFNLLVLKLKLMHPLLVFQAFHFCSCDVVLTESNSNGSSLVNFINLLWKQNLISIQRWLQKEWLIEIS